jgi:hypothetical protein
VKEDGFSAEARHYLYEALNIYRCKSKILSTETADIEMALARLSK